MCLMCEHYLDICDHRACVLKAQLQAEQNTALREEFFTSRNGNAYFLWKGYSKNPCVHIRARHGKSCTVVKRVNTAYGMMYEECNCDLIDGVYKYY